MNDNLVPNILRAIGLLIKPVIRLALRNGITFKQFSELCKELYVDVAAADYGVNGRDTNVSRIALMTGINRKDIKYLKTVPSAQDLSYTRAAPDRVSRILSAWHRAPYVNAVGEPLALPIEGAISFTALVEEFGGDVAVVTLLREFKRSAVIEVLASGNIRVLKRYFIPNPSADPSDAPENVDPRAIVHASSILNDHITTIFHNLYREKTGLPKRFERRVTHYSVDQHFIPEFQQLVELKGQKLLEEIDDWLSSHQVSETQTSDNSIRLGFGTYWIQNKSQQEM